MDPQYFMGLYARTAAAREAAIESVTANLAATNTWPPAESREAAAAAGRRYHDARAEMHRAHAWARSAWRHWGRIALVAMGYDAEPVRAGASRVCGHKELWWRPARAGFPAPKSGDKEAWSAACLAAAAAAPTAEETVEEEMRAAAAEEALDAAETSRVEGEK